MPSISFPLPSRRSSANLSIKIDVAVIGAGQAGLSAAYHLQARGLTPMLEFVVLDAAPRPGGAWQHRWPTLTLSTVNHIHDLPGLSFAEIVGAWGPQVQARLAVPEYFAAYEQQFHLPVMRPARVSRVTSHGERLKIELDRGSLSVRGIINATGTWETPFIPQIPGAERFCGQQLHTRDYREASVFEGRHVIIVGGGISALQLLDEVSAVTTTTWVTRRPPEFQAGAFDEARGRAAVALVEQRVRQGLPPQSVVSVTGLALTPAIEAMRARGVLNRRPMFREITERGVRWADGTELRADVILWCTGFRSALDHLAPLDLYDPAGGVRMTGRLATQVEKDPRIHLVGYGPSASTVGANRAGRAAATELLTFLSLL